MKKTVLLTIFLSVFLITACGNEDTTFKPFDYFSTGEIPANTTIADLAMNSITKIGQNNEKWSQEGIKKLQDGKFGNIPIDKIIFKVKHTPHFSNGSFADWERDHTIEFYMGNSMEKSLTAKSTMSKLSKDTIGEKITFTLPPEEEED